MGLGLPSPQGKEASSKGTDGEGDRQATDGEETQYQTWWTCWQGAQGVVHPCPGQHCPPKAQSWGLVGGPILLLVCGVMLTP